MRRHETTDWRADVSRWQRQRSLLRHRETFRERQGPPVKHDQGHVHDRKLVGAVVGHLIDRAHPSRVGFAKETGVSRPTLYRVLAGDPNVSLRVLRRVEGGLSLPYDTLSYIALHDWASLREIGVPADLVKWARRNAGVGPA